MEVIITAFVNDKIEFAPDSDTACIYGLTEDGKRVLFWGSPDDGMKNINAVRAHPLPMTIIIDPSECAPTPHVKKKYNVWLSIPDKSSISIAD